MRKPCPGFTLVELLVVASIMAILFSLSMAYYNQFNRAQILNQAVLELKNNLRLAQSMASAGEKPSSDLVPCNSLEGYRVTFIAGVGGAPDSYEIQAQCSNDLKGTPKIFSFPAVVRFETVPPLLLFKVLGKGRGVGGVDETTGIRIISLTGFGIIKTMTVTKTGEIR